MTDLELLFLVLGIIYLWECGWWAKRGSLGFRTWLGKRWTIARPSRAFGTQHAGLVVAAPLPPLGTLLTTHAFPLSLSPQGVLAYVSPGLDLSGPGPQPGRFAPFSEIQQLEARAKSLRLNGKEFLKTASPTFAAHLANILEQLKSAKAEDRKKIIERELSRAFETKGVERLWTEFQNHAAGLRFSVNLLFVYLFALTPFMLWRVGLIRGWPFILVGVLICTLTIAIQYHATHKKFYPNAEDERFTHFIILLLSPASAVRALDLLTHPLLEAFHPLAVAKVFCSQSQFESLATESLREISYPAIRTSADAQPGASSTGSFARELNKNLMESFLRRSGLDPKKVLRPPSATDPSCQSYCPRCLAQFTQPSGECPDCGSVELVPFSVPAGNKPQRASRK
jgi:hypothetical protein